MHIQYFEGGNALSAFRAHGLVAHLRLISDRVCGVSCQAVHWLWTDEALSADARNRFAALLSYGEPPKLTGLSSSHSNDSGFPGGSE